MINSQKYWTKIMLILVEKKIFSYSTNLPTNLNLGYIGCFIIIWKYIYKPVNDTRKIIFKAQRKYMMFNSTGCGRLFITLKILVFLKFLYFCKLNWKKLKLSEKTIQNDEKTCSGLFFSVCKLNFSFRLNTLKKFFLR